MSDEPPRTAHLSSPRVSGGVRAGSVILCSIDHVPWTRRFAYDTVPHGCEAVKGRNEGRAEDQKRWWSNERYSVAPTSRCHRRPTVAIPSHPRRGPSGVGEDHGAAPIRGAGRAGRLVFGGTAGDLAGWMPRPDRSGRRRSGGCRARWLVGRHPRSRYRCVAGRTRCAGHRRSACHRLHAGRIRARPAHRPATREVGDRRRHPKPS